MTRHPLIPFVMVKGGERMAEAKKVSPGIQAEIARSKCFGLACDPNDPACKKCSLTQRCLKLTTKVVEAMTTPKGKELPVTDQVFERKDTPISYVPTPNKPDKANIREDGTTMNATVQIVNGQNPAEDVQPVKIADAEEIGVGAAAEAAAEKKDADPTAQTVAEAVAAEKPANTGKAKSADKTAGDKTDKPKKPKKPATQYSPDMPDFKSMSDDQLKEHLRGAGVDVAALEAKHGGDARILRMQMVMAAKKPYKLG